MYKDEPNKRRDGCNDDMPGVSTQKTGVISRRRSRNVLPPIATITPRMEMANAMVPKTGRRFRMKSDVAANVSIADPSGLLQTGFIRDLSGPYLHCIHYLAKRVSESERAIDNMYIAIDKTRCDHMVTVIDGLLALDSFFG